MLLGALSCAAVSCSPGPEASAQQPAAGGRGGGRGGPQPAVPVTVAPVVAKAMPIDIRVIGTTEAFSTVADPRADHRRAHLRQFQGRRRREEGPGPLHARPPSARSGAPAGTGQPYARSGAARQRARAGGALPRSARARHRHPRAGRSDYGERRRRPTPASARTARRSRTRRFSLQYATIAAPIAGRTGALHGARGQSGARERHDAARRHQPGRTDLCVASGSPKRSFLRSSGTWQRSRSR